MSKPFSVLSWQKEELRGELYKKFEEEHEQLMKTNLPKYFRLYKKFELEELPKRLSEWEKEEGLKK